MIVRHLHYVWQCYFGLNSDNSALLNHVISVREYEEFEEEEYMEEEVEPIKSYRQPAPRPAAPRQPAPSSAPSSGFRIIVSNLHPAVTLGDVEVWFTQHFKI